MSERQPRVLAISQWPKIKNAEYELIEKMRKTGYPITVVDFNGYDVATGKCLNDVDLPDLYDYAISFHYDTPKFLNLRTFLWVANPLEFMHFQTTYRTTLIQHLRAYDDYLFNGSSLLKSHIRQVLGEEWVDNGLTMIGSSSHAALVPPEKRNLGGSDAGESAKIFYCGVNWERGVGKAGRAQGLLDTLQARGLADFYGPRKLEGIDPWAGFSSYRGEIPFDGISMFSTMARYGAVLAVSSPAHMKSKTASGRVFEGLASGTPVISDENPHVRKQFGDLVYYFSGNTEQEKADSIERALKQILDDPQDAARRVSEAQALIAREYSFEVRLSQALASVDDAYARARARFGDDAPNIDLYLFDHDPFAGDNPIAGFANVPHILRAAEEISKSSRARITIKLASPSLGIERPAVLPANVAWEEMLLDDDVVKSWPSMRMGEKVALLAKSSRSDFVVFFNQLDYPQYDYFVKALEWFRNDGDDRSASIYVAGFFVNDFSSAAPPSAAGILRNSSSNGLYRWTQDSVAEHQMGSVFFSREALQRVAPERLARFDVLLPMAVVIAADQVKIRLHRGRHLTLRVSAGYFHRYHAVHTAAEARGFWALQYDMPTNFTHEINSLYDAFHEHRPAVAIADMLVGYDQPRAPFVHPGVERFNYLVERVGPVYRFARKLWRASGLARLRAMLVARASR
ncbi:glycosyltransferase [Xanthomonas sacchari]|uniref:glycosyltransferase family protein n=1 Tax=Xanthomonas sacchari TaxID=56458 RepID=UPI00225DDDC8|nr:glycosyltransferase [Xanthomonas sacchari]UYK80194.1 glycosyltransferase [Xanthomonas sacchari]